MCTLVAICDCNMEQRAACVFCFHERQSTFLFFASCDLQHERDGICLDFVVVQVLALRLSLDRQKMSLFGCDAAFGIVFIACK